MKNILFLSFIFCITISCKKEEEPEEKSCFFVENALVFEGDATLEWQDLNLSEVVGENHAKVTLKLTNHSEGFSLVTVYKTKGDLSNYEFGGNMQNMTNVIQYSSALVTIDTDALGMIEWKSQHIRTVSIEVVSYIK